MSASLYRVEKMKFAKTRDPETNKPINNKTTVFYNDRLTLRDIREEACEYVVNGKRALEWVMGGPLRPWPESPADAVTPRRAQGSDGGVQGPTPRAPPLDPGPPAQKAHARASEPRTPASNGCDPAKNRRTASLQDLCARRKPLRTALRALRPSP